MKDVFIRAGWDFMTMNINLHDIYQVSTGSMY